MYKRIRCSLFSRFKFKKGKKYQLIDRNESYVIIGEVAIPVNVFNTHFKEI